MARRGLAAVFVSVTTLDHQLARVLEPRAAAPGRRLRVISTLSAAGIPVHLSVAPVIRSRVLRTQGIGDLYRIFIETCRDRLDFNLAYIPSDFTEKAEAAFDVEYMRDLYDMAYERASSGYQWEKMPPELKAAPIRCH